MILAYNLSHKQLILQNIIILAIILIILLIAPAITINSMTQDLNLFTNEAVKMRHDPIKVTFENINYSVQIKHNKGLRKKNV